MTRQNVFMCVELIELVSEYFSMIFFSFFLKKTSQLNNTHSWGDLPRIYGPFKSLNSQTAL